MTLFSRSFWSDLFLTYIAEIIVMVCAFLCPGMVARLGGIDQLGIYLLLRRVASSLIAPLSLGLGVALVRSLPICPQAPYTRVRWSAFALLTATVFASLFAVVMLASKDQMAQLLLGSSRLSNFIQPLSLLLMGNVVHAVLYSHFRGMIQMRPANILQALNLGIVPVVALLELRSMGLAAAIRLTGLLMLATSAAFLVSPLRTLWRTRSAAIHGWISKASRAMLPYGLGRVPGFAFAGLLFVLGPIWLAHRASMSDVGIYALGLTFVRIAGAFFGPIGILLLPRLAGVSVKQGRRAVGTDLQMLFRMTFLLGVFGSLQAAVLKQTVLFVWLGTSPASSNVLLMPLILALPLYLSYEVLRNPIDAISSIPYNTLNLGGSLLFLLAGILKGSVAWLVAGQVTAFALLGISSIVTLKHLYGIEVFQLRHWKWPLLFSIASMPITWLVQFRFSDQILGICAFELLLCALFLWMMVRTNNAPRYSVEQEQWAAATDDTVTTV